MAKTLEELRVENPELANQLMAEAQAAASASAGADNAEAVESERNRLAEIDAVAHLFDKEVVQEAKYGEKPCTAQEMSYREAQRAAQQGTQFLKNLETDNSASGAQKVGAAPGAPLEGEPAEDSLEAIEASAKAAVAAFQKKKEAR